MQETFHYCLVLLASVEEEVQPPVVESPKQAPVVHLPPPEPEIQEPEGKIIVYFVRFLSFSCCLFVHLDYV